MSWSLEVRGGDLVVDGARLGDVKGHRKMVQDLSHWILEPMGTDNLHMRYGSLIDGGLRDGVQHPSMVGSSNDKFLWAELQAEINRIIKDYQRIQLNRARTDKYTLNNSTLTREEVLYNVKSVDFVQREDRVFIAIAIQNGSGSVLDMMLPIEAS